MRKISDTINRLGTFGGRQATIIAPFSSGASAATGALDQLDNFGSNPGALGAWFYVPEIAKQPMPLVVVLHGCTQNARDYDHGAGWSQLADELGFAVLLPEQRRSNNFNLCFNWYETSDNRRDIGEPASIKQMVDCMVERHGVDPDRVFVNGLSAGGAMTSVMLATYPETFAAGAIIAGLPYGSASGVTEAFDRMRGHGSPDGSTLAQLVRAASSTGKRWPMISVWHGDTDYTVSADNADDIIEQWRPLHGANQTPDVSDTVNGYPHRVWHDSKGRAAIQDYRITGMGHGTPLATTGDDACGMSGAYMLDVAISSTRRIAQDWSLGSTELSNGRAPNDAPQIPARVNVPIRNIASSASPAAAPTSAGNVSKIIEDALRSAGLL